MRDDELMHYASRGAEFLAHHGVKGQRWGKRRYQNTDGSLTPEGRIHYGYNSDETSGAYGLPDHEYGGHYSGRAEGRGSSSNGRRGPYANDKEYGPEDYEDVDYKDLGDIDVKYKEEDVKSRYDNTPKQGMQEALNKQAPSNGMSGREKFATAAQIAAQTSQALQTPLKTLSEQNKAKKRAMAREMNAAGIENLTDQQLQAVINRRRLERTYLDETTPEVTSGYDKTMQLLQGVGMVAATSLAVLKVVDEIKQMKG